MNIKITESQLLDIRKRLGENEDIISESPDKVNDKNDNNIAHWSNNDAIAFGFINNKVYLGCNIGLFNDSPNISNDVKQKINEKNPKFIEKLNKHTGIGEYYDIVYDDYFYKDRDDFQCPGRLWFQKKVISFWRYPNKSDLPTLLKSLSFELNKMFGIQINFNDYQIEIKKENYESDLDIDDEDFIDDIDWETSKKTGTLIPISQFVGSEDASAEEMQNIHSLPSDEKRNTSQMKAARDADAERLANKFNGDVSQVEWNSAKNKYRGESKTIIITKNQLNEISSSLNNIEEDIKLPIKVGDTILMGRFKNKKVVVKTIGKDDYGMPTINGKKAATFRMIKEGKDEIYGSCNGVFYNLSSEDVEAMPFVYYNNKVYVGYTPALGDDYVESGYEDSNGETNYPNYHDDITGFYKFINKDNPEYEIKLPMYRNDFSYIGRIWLDTNVISFYKYPEDKNKMKEILRLLSDEIYNVYGETYDFTNTLVDTSTNDDNISLTPMDEYIGGSNVSDEEMESPHLLPSDKKRDNKQFKQSLDAKYQHIGDKLGNVTQAEYNHYKRYGMGEEVIKENTPDIYFKENTIEDTFRIEAFDENVLIGTVVSEDITQDYYQYEFDDVWSEDEFEDIFPDYHICKIESIDVIPEYQNMGVAKKLLNMLIEKKRNDGYTQFYLNASPMGFNGLELGSLVEFYKKFGFKILLNQGGNVLMGITNYNSLTEATESDVNLSSFKPKKELNEKFWENEKLKPVVRKRLLKIADDFIEYLKIDIKKVHDIVFLGSMANFNWSSYSDVDLHLIVDFSKINKDVELVTEYFDSKKKLWNDEHSALKIYGFPIEVYVQDIKQENASVGQFSLEKNKWLKKPEVIDDADFNKKKIKEKAATIMTDIEDLLKAYKSKPSFSELTSISNKTKKTYDKIKKLRKQGLESEDGETSIGNIVFKVLRRNGYLEKLIDLKLVTYDRINSIK